jgi:hypothetical protein
MPAAIRPDKSARILEALAKKMGFPDATHLPLTPSTNVPIAGVPIALRLVFSVLKPNQLGLLLWCWLRAGKDRVFYTPEPAALLELGRSGRGTRDLHLVLRQLEEAGLITFHRTSTGELQVAVLDPVWAIRNGLAKNNATFSQLLGNPELKAHAADVAEALKLEPLF